MTNDEARQAFKERSATLKAKPILPPKSAPPRYDEVFTEGQAWLDGVAKIKVTDDEFDKLEAAFSQDVKHNPKLKKAARKNDEAHLQAAILIAWGSHPRLRIARINTGAAMFGGQLVRFNPPGTGDLVGLIAPTGRMIQIELKTAKGKQREAQIRMQRIVTQFGGAYCLARSLADVDAFFAEMGITR